MVNIIAKTENLDELTAYAQARGVKFVVLFGSRAVRAATDASDFDVALLFEGDRSFHEDSHLYVDLLENIGRILETGSARLDLTDLGRANILLRYEVTRSGKLLYGDADAYAEFQAFAFREYMDARSLFELERKVIEKRQKILKAALIRP